MYKIIKVVDGEISGDWLTELDAIEDSYQDFLRLFWNMTALHEAKRQQASGEQPMDADTMSDREIAGL
jgi:hypothetical protein